MKPTLFYPFISLLSSLLLLSCNDVVLLQYKIGLQLFSVRDAMAKDPLATLKTLKEMGYQDVETYGFDADNATIYGYPVEEFKSILDDLGLSASSGHYGFADYMEATPEELTAYVEKCIAAAKTLESSYITWPFVPEAYHNPEGFKQLAKLLDQIGQQVTQAGLGFAYHNHGYEFEAWNGKTGFQLLIENTNPDWVKFQLDLYWAVHSGASPKALVKAQPGRFVMWHIKDMDRNTRDYTELGNGSIDYNSILPNPTTAGLSYYYIEQGGNFRVNSLTSAKESIAYLKKNLLHLL